MQVVIADVGREPVHPRWQHQETRVRTIVEDFNFASVTLEVDPVQAQALSLVQSSGDNLLMLSLRNNDDTDRVNIPSVMLGDVLGADAGRMRAPAGVRR